MSSLNVKVDRKGHQNRLNNALNKLLTHSPDITIVAEDGNMEVDRLLLLMYSPTLRSAISEQNCFSSILFPDYSIKSVRALIDLLVSGFSSSNAFSAQDLGSVLEIAKDLQIQIDHGNVEMVESKVDTELVSIVTKSVIPFETKSLNDFKTQDCATLPNDSISKLNFPGSVQEDNCGDLNYGNENIVKVEVVEDYGEKSVYLVRCKESWGEFHHEKFVSGSKGHCIFFKEKWMAPNDFEKLAGSKGKKYKETLHVNGKPLKLLIDPNGTRIATPSVKQRQFSNKSKIEAHMSILGTPVKGKGVQGSISHYFTPKLKKQENNLDQHYNKDEVRPSRGDVNLKNAMKGKSRIAEIADSKKRKRQSNEQNGARINKSKKMQLDIIPEVNVKHASMISEGENSTRDNDKDDFFSISDAFPSDDESCTENPLIIDLNYADNCLSPIVSESNAKRIINNVFQELMDSIQFEKESNLKASVGTSNGNLDNRFLNPVAKRANTRYSEEQTSGLCKAFDDNSYLSKEKAQELSKELCLTENRFKKSRAKTKAVTYKHDDKLKVKTEIVDEIEHHLEEMIDEENELKSTDEKVHKIQNDIENLFEAYSNIENQCTCECGVTFKNAKLLIFHKHICRKSSESNATVKDAIMNYKGDSSIVDIDKDDPVITRNGFSSDGVKHQCSCECGGSFKNEMLLKFHKHACSTKVTKEGL